MQGRAGNTGESGAGGGLSPSQIMGGARPGGVLSFRRCGRSHEVRAWGPLILLDSMCRRAAGLASVGPGGRDEVEAVLKQPVPELGVGRSAPGPGLAGMGGWRPENARPREGWAPRPIWVASDFCADSGRAAAGSRLWPPYSLGAPDRSPAVLPCDVGQVSRRPRASDCLEWGDP